MTDRGIGIEGVTLRLAPDYLWLSSTKALRVLSSAVVGAEHSHVQNVLSVRVSLSYQNHEPERDLFDKAEALGIGQPFVGLLTAVDLSEAVVVVDVEADVCVAAAVTVGVGNATAAGSIAPGGTVPGTINIVLVVEADLSEGALVNTVITATEAKALALFEMGVQTAAGEVASGTSSDAIVVACTGKGHKLRYAGPATAVGLCIGRAVRRAIEGRLKEIL